MFWYCNIVDLVDVISIWKRCAVLVVHLHRGRCFILIKFHIAGMYVADPLQNRTSDDEK